MPGTSFNSEYTRVIEHLASDGSTVVATYQDGDSLFADGVVSASFDILRQGGCADGTLVVDTAFLETAIDTGEHIRLSYKTGGVANAWYLGRVEQVDDSVPAEAVIRMYGWMSYLNDRTIGGPGQDSLDDLPVLYTNDADLFLNDPDYAIQVYTPVDYYHELVGALYTNYIAPYTPISLGTVNTPTIPVEIGSRVFRGQESVAAIVRELAVAQYGAAYGVNAQGQFFMLNRPTSGTLSATFQEGVDITAMSRSTDRSLIVNSLIIIGDYIYEPLVAYRYARKFKSLSSINTNGERKRTIYVPWLRTDAQALRFAQQIFDDYDTAVTRYSVQVEPQGAMVWPWSGYVRIFDIDGNAIVTEEVSRVSVEFDEAPQLTFHLGPEDLQFPEPPVNQRSQIGGQFDDNNSSGAGSSGGSGSLSGSLSGVTSSAFQAGLINLGKTNEDISAGGSGSVSVYTPGLSPGSDVDTGEDYTMFSRSGAGSGLWVNWIDRGDYLECFLLECG